jgi:hypothetical protein
VVKTGAVIVAKASWIVGVTVAGLAAFMANI